MRRNAAGSDGQKASDMRIPLSRPDIGDSERQAVQEVLESGRLSLGPRILEFERAIADAADVKHAVATSSGTAALHLAVRCLGIGQGDEVVTTPFSFVASANCLLYESARPVFVDVEPDTLNIDPGRIGDAVTDRTRAILAVDIFGHPADWDALRALAERHDLLLIEDSAEALGSSYQGRAAGGFGDVGIFGFYPNKQITTGEGGALVTADDGLAELCASLRNHGREPDGDEWIEHKRLGYNYRLSEIACALGLVQLQRLQSLMRRRELVAAWYHEKLAGLDAIGTPVARDGVRMSRFVYVVRLATAYGQRDRDRIVAALKSRGIGCRSYFPPIHLQPVFRDALGCRPGDFPMAEAAAQRTIALPFFAGLKESEVDEVVATLRGLL
jgi:perosamine synthetase